MERSILQSEAVEAKDSFAETFGRGCLIKYKEPTYSERNNFELQKMKAERAGRLHEYSHKHWLTTGDPQPKRQPAEAGRGASRCSDFEKIDEINSKICGLIKSISSSCHKKTPLELKSQRDSSIKALPNNYTAGKEKNMDHQKTQKKRKDLEQDHIRSKLFDFDLDKNKEKYAYSNLDTNNSIQHQGFVDMNARIKKINDKISIYENKIKGSIKEPAINMKEVVKNRPLRQYKNFVNINQTPNKVDKKQSIPKFTQNCMKYLLNERQNQNSKPNENQYPTQAKKGEKGAELFRKTALFNEKSSQITAKYGKQEQQYIFDRLKFSTNEQKIERIPMEEPKDYARLQKNAINLINTQLLSYKTQFLKEMVKQISLDQEFRHAKHVFGGIEGLFNEDNPSQKWSNLQRQLKKEGFNLPLSEVKEIFMPRDDEIDPFMSVSHSHEQLVHGLIHSYRSCQRNWNENMYHSWSLWELKESKFTAQNLDQSRKGSIALEDLTFYLNTELDGNYRNRDLMLIFNRFRGTKLKAKGGAERTEEVAIRFKDVIDKLLSA